MADPLSIAAGVVGILTAATQISSVLIKFVRSTKGAPYQARAIITEVNDTSGILSHLQAFLLGKEFADVSRTSMIRANHLINIISSCVLTFSELEKLLDELETGEMDILDCVKWTRKETAIAGLIQRLQNHKASLSLILNILNGASIIEANNSVNRLFTLVENHYQEISFRLQTLERYELEQNDDQSVLENDVVSIATVTAEGPNAIESVSRASGIRTFDFNKDLQKSWAYTRNHAFRESGFSLSMRSRFTSRWSYLSALSMADVSTISVVNLPVTESEVFNGRRSSQTWSNERSEPIWPLQCLDNSERFSSVSLDMRDDVLNDDGYLCEVCGGTLQEGKAFILAGYRWHIDCFRCTTCQIDSDANLLLLRDGSLICRECTGESSVRWKQIEDIPTLTGDKAFGLECFRCRNCKKQIDSPKYARSSRGIFCMDCHESLMARRRKRSRGARLPV